MGEELFETQGLQITRQNFLEVYDYDAWSEKVLPDLKEGDVLTDFELSVRQGQTTAPQPLTEASLISKMDENGIGTDATIHEHIKNVQVRGYAKKQGINIVPTQLGISLVETYRNIGLNLYEPKLRAKMEADMKDIAEGLKSKSQVLESSISDMTELYDKILKNKKQMQSTFAKSIGNDTFDP